MQVVSELEDGVIQAELEVGFAGDHEAQHRLATLDALGARAMWVLLGGPPGLVVCGAGRSVGRGAARQGVWNAPSQNQAEGCRTPPPQTPSVASAPPAAPLPPRQQKAAYAEALERVREERPDVLPGFTEALRRVAEADAQRRGERAAARRGGRRRGAGA